MACVALLCGLGLPAAPAQTIGEDVLPGDTPPVATPQPPRRERATLLPNGVTPRFQPVPGAGDATVGEGGVERAGLPPLFDPLDPAPDPGLDAPADGPVDGPGDGPVDGPVDGPAIGAVDGPADSPGGLPGDDPDAPADDGTEAPAPGVTTPRAEGGRFKAAPFKTPEFPEVDRSIALGDTRAADRARLRVLDMITGQTVTLDIATGLDAIYQRLTLRLVACARPEQRGGIGDVGLIQITDRRRPGGPVFSGWMFAESPALSALDHPRYDVWLISCIARKPEISGGNASNEPSRDSASASNAR